MRSSAWARTGAIAALLGGGAWVGKGGTILVTGWEPPLFAFGPPLFILALFGLHAVLEHSSLTRAYVLLAGLALLGFFVVVLLFLFAPSHAPSDDGSLRLGGLLLFASGIGTLGALVVLGTDTFRQRPFPAPWHALPLAMGIAPFPLILLFGAIGEMTSQEVATRVIEVPIVLVGLAWIALGVLLWRRASVTPKDSTPSPATGEV